MAEHLRQPSARALPISSSPGRPSPLSRPHWPWSTYTHRSSSSTSVFTSTGSTPAPMSWESRSSMSSPSTVLVTTPGAGKRALGLPGTSYQVTAQDEASTRQWSFTAFEWVVRDVHKLRDYIETPEQPDDESSMTDMDEFEILKESPMIGDGKFKLEIAKGPTIESADGSAPSSSRNHLPTLSLYVTSLMIDFAHADYEMPTSMFAAIKCQDDRAGERGARPEWAWEFWQDGWVFRQESEVWECPLPPLSSLLENPRIKETDSFVICVQMHSPVGPFFPQQPSAYYVPRELLDGLEASLDNPNTGDVQFICFERQDTREDDSMEHSPPSPSITEVMSRSSSQPLISSTVARKRVIYAHADILTRRSEYFATMLSSSFSESATGGLYPGGRKVYTVVVEEADFVTIYWLLKFVYANYLLFRKEDDPREAVDGIGAGWSARGLSTPGAADEWEWKTFFKGMPVDSQPSISDARSMTSGGSVHSTGGSPQSKDKEKRPLASGQSHAPPSVQATTSRTTSASKSTSATPRAPAAAPSRRAGPSGGSSTLPVPPSTQASPSTSRSSKPAPVPVSPPAPNYVSGPPPHYPLSPRQQRQRSHPPAGSSPDPHAHPTPAPQPASALSMYQLAHRYAMPGLASLALEHIMSTITPQSSFAVLLATSTWEELHGMVEDYVVDKWEEVSVSEEFERCCQEVAAGEWGPDGGKTMMGLFRRLRSPSVAA